jgi:hypothetical protein
MHFALFLATIKQLDFDAFGPGTMVTESVTYARFQKKTVIAGQRPNA